MTKPYSHDWKPIFLAFLRDVPVVSSAVFAAGLDARSTAYRARETDPEFAAAWDDAMETGVDMAEREAFRRAVEGYEDPVVDKGQLCYRMQRVLTEDPDNPDGPAKVSWTPILGPDGQPIPLTVRKHSDSLLTLFLKGRRKKVYSDRTEITGPDGGPQQVETTDSPTQLARKIAFALALGVREANKPKPVDDMEGFV
jgi:hypothetical protein